VATTQDFFSIQGTRNVYHEAKKAYTALGEPDNIQLSEDDAGHDCTTKNREAIIAFFQLHLKNPGDSKEVEVVPFELSDLKILPTGLVQKSLKAETFFGLNLKHTDDILKKLASEKQNYPDFSKNLAQKAKSLAGYCEPALPKESIFSGRLWRGDCAIEKYLVKGAGDYYIPVLRFYLEKNNGNTILLLDDQGKASAAAKAGLAERLASQGYQVIVPDLNGFGELSGGYKDGDATIQGVHLNIWYAGLLTGKSPLGIRVEEIKILTDFIRTLGLSGSLTGVACGTLTSDLLHAALFNREFDQIALLNPLYAYESIVRERDYLKKFVMSTPPGVVGKYDLSDMVAALAPLKILMINPVNSLDKKVEKHLFDQTYSEAKNKYGNSQNWTVVFNEQDEFSKLEQWMKLIKD
jgi:hypothetical protein